MTNQPGDESLVTLNAPPSLEETLVDWLLARRRGAGFTAFPVQGHSTRHDHLSIAEQVSGRQRRLQYQVQMATADVDEFLDELRAALGGADIHFWVAPLSRSGRLSQSAS